MRYLLTFCAHLFSYKKRKPLNRWGVTRRLCCGWKMPFTGSTAHIYVITRAGKDSEGIDGFLPFVSVSVKGISLRTKRFMVMQTHQFPYREYHKRLKKKKHKKSWLSAFKPSHNVFFFFFYFAVVNLIPLQAGLCQRCLFFTRELLLHQWDCLYLPACSLGSDSALYIRVPGLWEACGRRCVASGLMHSLEKNTNTSYSLWLQHRHSWGSHILDGDFHWMSHRFERYSTGHGLLILFAVWNEKSRLNAGSGRPCKHPSAPRLQDVLRVALLDDTKSGLQRVPCPQTALLLRTQERLLCLTQDIPRCTAFHCCSVILDRVPGSSCQRPPINTHPTLALQGAFQRCSFSRAFPPYSKHIQAQNSAKQSGFESLT